MVGTVSRAPSNTAHRRFQHVLGFGLHADPYQRGADQKPWLSLALSNLGLPSVVVDWGFGDAMRVVAVHAALMLRAAG